MSLKQICFFSVFFSDDEDEPADPNIILEEPDDEASKSDKDVSDATGLMKWASLNYAIRSPVSDL